MSATARTRLDGSEYQRSPTDFYQTPAWTTRALLPYLPPARGKAFRVYDAGAGNAAIADVLPYGKLTVCVENDPRMAEACAEKGYVTHCVDWEKWNVGADVVVLNPPFGQAQEFIEHALHLTKGAVVAALLRINFMEGQARAPFHIKNPAHVLVLPRRPSFTGGGTDATGYMWACWGANPGAEKQIVANRWDILSIEPHQRVKKS